MNNHELVQDAVPGTHKAEINQSNPNDKAFKDTLYF